MLKINMTDSLQSQSTLKFSFNRNTPVQHQSPQFIRRLIHIEDARTADTLAVCNKQWQRFLFEWSRDSFPMCGERGGCGECTCGTLTTKQDNVS
jgi:hypothetical protein